MSTIFRSANWVNCQGKVWESFLPAVYMTAHSVNHTLIPPKNANPSALISMQ